VVFSLYILAYSVERYLTAWFNSNFADNYSLFVSLVRFTEDHVSNQIGELFVSFGLSLRKGDDPSSFRNLNFLIENSKQYETMGRWRRLTSNIERYPTTINLINLVVYLSVMALALAALAFGYPAVSHLLRG
jgi:hypothetical protein